MLKFFNLLKNPKKPDKTYPAYPQVLFTNYEVIDKELFDSTTILNICWLSSTYPPFCFSLLLLWILKVILLGLNSLSSSQA